MKKLLSIAVISALCLSLASCGAKTSPATSASTAPSVAPSAVPSTNVVLKVGASPSPHAEILKIAKELLAKDGITLEIVEFTDYVLPNTTLDAGDLDANYFQHQPYLDSFNKENSTDIVPVTTVHFEPIGLYPGKSSDIKDIKDGAVFAVPSDPSNEARALLLLQDLGIIKLKDGVGLEATPIDVVENPHNIEFFELEAAQLVRTLSDVDFAVINGNYAVDGGILDKVLTVEDKDGTAGETYANVLAVNNGKENDENIQKLAKALNSQEVKTFIQERYKGLFVSTF